jgi:hypothetical protein
LIPKNHPKKVTKQQVRLDFCSSNKNLHSVWHRVGDMKIFENQKHPSSSSLRGKRTLLKGGLYFLKKGMNAQSDQVWLPNLCSRH